MEACSASAESGDGRTVFSLTPGGQLKMPRLGNYCVTMAGESAASSDIAQGADLTATSSNGQHSVKNIEKMCDPRGARNHVSSTFWKLPRIIQG